MPKKYGKSYNMENEMNEPIYMIEADINGHMVYFVSTCANTPEKLAELISWTRNLENQLRLEAEYAR